MTRTAKFSDLAIGDEFRSGDLAWTKISDHTAALSQYPLSRASAFYPDEDVCVEVAK